MNEDGKSLVLRSAQRQELVRAAGVEGLLALIRPEWRAKSLIDRVRRLLPVDPSSACQRLFNAAIHDLREKIVAAGMDIAKEAAARHDLPPVNKEVDILEEYSTARTIDLAYRMGILSPPEWRRLKRAYEIRRDLEHEDDHYEAQVEDIVYIFRSAVEIVLQRDPIDILRVSDVKDLIDAPKATAPTKAMLEDYQVAPEPRQREIMEFLINTALNPKNADITRRNAYEMLLGFRETTKTTVRVELGQLIQARISKRPLDEGTAKVAIASGAFPYLKQRQVREFYEAFAERMFAVGFHWKQWSEHGELLGDLEELGGVQACPSGPRERIVLWMVKCYVGELGGYGWYGRGRAVFYSDTATPLIERLIRNAAPMVDKDIVAAAGDAAVKAATKDKLLARRLEQLRDLASADASK